MLVSAKPGKIKHAELQPSAWLQVFQAEMKSLFAGTKNGATTIDDALATAFKILLDRIEAFPNDRDIIVARIWLDLVALDRCSGGTFGVTELAPQNDRSGREVIISKCILPNGTVVPYPKVKWWRQVVTHVPPTIGCVFDYLVEARQRNICLIRGAPANLKRKLTRRWKAYVTHQTRPRR